MNRKWLFGALTVVLLAVLIGLMIQGHKLEKQTAGQPVEILQRSKPTPTRALAPKDIELLRSEMKMEPDGASANKASIARHAIEIRNVGKVPYDNIEVSFDYLDSGGGKLDTRTHSINQTIAPGSSLNVEDIEIDDIPSSTVDFSATILFADIGKSGAPGQ